jgi:SAM-dependent methyltransferase
MPTDYFDDLAAENYDSREAEMFSPEVLEPAVDFLCALAGDGPVLEFGIGTGRVAIPLAKIGLQVHGIDLSEAMIAKIGHKPGGELVHSVAGDFSETRVPGSFSLVYLVFNTIMNLTTQEAQIACFRNAASHLNAGGYFVIEVMTPDLQRLPFGETIRANTVAGDRASFDEYDIVSQSLISHHLDLHEGQARKDSVPFRYVWPAELDLMAQLAGLRLKERWGGWNREPFTNISTSHVSVWQKV